MDADHPAVSAAMTLLDDQNATLAATLHRDDVVAVIAENHTTRWHILVEEIDNRWEVPTLIGGHGRHAASTRQDSTGNPPMLDEQQITRSGRPGHDGGPPVASWCVVTGRAAMDAKTMTVDTGLDVQTCEVTADGSVRVLVYAPWAKQPEIFMETATGDIIRLFTG